MPIVHPNTSLVSQHLPWTEKYRPEAIKDIVGQNKAVAEIIQWLKLWENKPPSKRALFIQGGTGIGKTSAIEAIALNLNFDLFELNASDVRDKEKIARIAGAAAYQATLTDDPTRFRIILMDEAEQSMSTKQKNAMLFGTNFALLCFGG